MQIQEQLKQANFSTDPYLHQFGLATRTYSDHELMCAFLACRRPRRQPDDARGGPPARSPNARLCGDSLLLIGSIFSVLFFAFFSVCLSSLAPGT